MDASLLHYRPWRGQLRGSWSSLWPVARVALGMMFRRKMFWVLYAFGLLFFFMFFFGQYLLAWAEQQSSGQTVPVFLGVKLKTEQLIEALRVGFKLHGTNETYRNFFKFQGSMVIVILAMAGSIVVGSDFQFGSLSFYLSKPLSSWHYVLGKCLAVAVFVNLMTTLPAIVLFIQYGLLTTWDYYWQNLDLLAGIYAYGMLLTVCLSLILLAVASWLKRTVPIVMAWTTIFIFLRFLADTLVDGLHYDVRWRLLNLWNDMTLVGSAFFGIAPDQVWPYRQPSVYEAAFALGAVCLSCLTYLTLRIRAVEIVG